MREDIDAREISRLIALHAAEIGNGSDKRERSNLAGEKRSGIVISPTSPYRFPIYDSRHATRVDAIARLDFRASGAAGIIVKAAAREAVSGLLQAAYICAYSCFRSGKFLAFYRTV